MKVIKDIVRENKKNLQRARMAPLQKRITLASDFSTTP